MISKEEEFASEHQLVSQCEKEMSILTILNSSKFKHLFCLGVCHLFYGYYFTNEYKQFAKFYINDDSFLSMIGAVSALFNGFFKFFWATLLDYHSFKKIYGFLICLEICMILLVSVAVYNKWAFFLVSCLTYMCDGSL